MYVNSVKFAEKARIFITGTNSGEVKLWSTEGMILGTLNSMDWDDRIIQRYIGGLQQPIGVVLHETDLKIDISKK